MACPFKIVNKMRKKDRILSREPLLLLLENAQNP
jgi:hypothetical protein